MTEFDTAMRVEDVASLATTAARTLGVERASRSLRISPDDLRLLSEGRLADIGSVAALRARVTGWARANNDSIFRAAGRPVPPFNHLADFWENFYQGPREPIAIQADQRKGRTKFLDFDLAFPFGVPACALTPHSSYIGYFARRAFDLLTYKTVRDRSWYAHPFPQWAFAVDTPDMLAVNALETPIQATLDPGIDRSSLLNSFGVPSLKPDEWQADVENAKQLLSKGQVLIVSVMGSPEEAADDAELAQQFAATAAFAVEAGADIVEANLSCPNTGGELICRSPDTSEAVLKAICDRDELKRSRTPVFAKISYLDESKLEAFARRCGKYLQGIVAINTVSVPVIAADGTPFFGKRNRAGLSGPSILGLGLSVAQRLVELRGHLFAQSDWVIVGVGGVTRPDDFEAYMQLGVDAVQSCSGAWLEPDLAVQIQQRRGVAPTIMPALDAPLIAARLALLQILDAEDTVDRIELAVATRLSPSQTQQALDFMIAKRWVEEHGTAVRATRLGKDALREFRGTDLSPPVTAATASPADQALDLALAAIQRRRSRG